MQRFRAAGSLVVRQNSDDQNVGRGIHPKKGEIVVDVDAERLRDDVRNPRTAEPRIARLELDDGLDECVARSLRPGLPAARRR